MPLKGKYIKYSQEITLEIFTLIYNKLINSGWTEYSNKIIELSYSQFKTQYNHLTHQQDKIFNTHICPYKKEYAETTVQEILGYDPFVKEFVFPEKWYVRVSDKNVKDIQLFKNKSNWSDNAARYKAVGYEGVGYNSLPENYTEITFDQFQKYVLKGIVEMPEVKEVIPEYAECIKKDAQVLPGMIYKIQLEKGFLFDGSDDVYYINNMPYYQSFFKPSTKEAYDARNKPKQPLKQAVHCKTREEWDFVLSKFNPRGLSKNKFLDYKENSVIVTVDFDSNVGRFGHLIHHKHQILSFQEWCDLHGYKMEKEVKFEVGQLVWISSKPITGNGMNLDGRDDGVYKLMDLDSPEFATGHLHENSHFKFKCGKFYYKTNIKNIRLATPEEINNHLISIGQIPMDIQSGSTSDNAYNHLISQGIKIHEEFFNPTVEFERNYDYTVNPKYKQEFNIINKTKTIKF